MNSFSKLSALSFVAMAAIESSGSEVVTGEPQTTGEPQPTIPTLQGEKFKYFFKTPVLKDPSTGKEIGKGKKHPDVTGVFPVPSNVEIAEYLLRHDGEKGEDGKLTTKAKVSEMLIDAVKDVIFQGGRRQINEFADKVGDKFGTEAIFTTTNFDLSQMSLEYLANLPKGQRGAWAPSDDELKSFCEDYTDVLTTQVQYDPKKVIAHCEVFMKGLAKIKSDKRAIKKMEEFLTLWASKKEEDDMEEFAETYNWLMQKADKYFKMEEKNYADAL